MFYIENLTREQISELILKTQTKSNLIYTSLHKQYLTIFNLLLREYGYEYKDEVKLLVHNTACALRDNCTGFPIVKDRGLFLETTEYLLSKYKKGTKVSHTKLWRLVGRLEKEGYLDIYVGCIYDGDKYTSRIVLSDRWLKLFTSVDHSKAPSTKEIYEPIIVSKTDGKGNKTGDVVKNIQGISKFKDEVVMIDRHLKGFNVNCTINNEDYKMNTQIHRSFIDNLDQGGRWFFPSQCIKKEFRQNMEIGGKPCVEWDYSAQHPRILYTKEDLLIPVDFKPYQVDISSYLEVEEGFSEKSLCKHILLLLINSGNTTLAINKDYTTVEKLRSKGLFHLISEEYRGIVIKDLKGLIEAIKAHNKPINKYFGREKHALPLQKLDSEIARFILVSSVEDNVCVIPYHDSFVTSCDNEEWMKVKMFQAWEHVLGTRDNCVIDKRF